jgi:protein-L-isoaspartate(D-aspartate) O-methyltransferase
MTLNSSTELVWTQVNMTCDSREAAEHVGVTALRPLLTDAQTTGSVSGWWFIRKGDTWRLRLESPAPGFVDTLITSLVQQPQVTACAATIYEPETEAFGGPEGLAAAHRLFTADSRFVLDHLSAAGNTHRRELPFILGVRLMRAARLEWHEQGDCWARLAQQRTAVADGEPHSRLISSVEQLLLSAADAPGSPLADMPAWTAAVQQAGHHLADLAGAGTLTRGLRAVLSHHLMFMFNRHGVPGTEQYRLATAARHAIFDSPGEIRNTTAGTVNTIGNPASLGAVTDTHTNLPDRSVKLRNDLADWIKRRGTFRTPAVETAFRTVPRELFIPDVPLDVAYGRTPVVTRRDEAGMSLSSASAPNMVATMLEQLDVRPGNSILEIGAATGINAALMAELTGPGGSVVTIEYDPAFAASAVDHLTAAGYPQVTVIAGDGALGHPDQAPYDRLILTAGAWDLPPAFWNQLAPHGRIVVPLRLHGSGLTRSLAFNRTDTNRLVAHGAVVCGFVPMRGTTERDELRIKLSDDVVFRVESTDQPDPAALTNAFSHPRHEHWTGITARYDHDPADHLDLWLLTHTTTSFGRLAVTGEARTAGIDPARRWGGAALYTDATLSYLITRDLTDDIAELGVVTCGPEHSTLTDTTIDLLNQWDKTRPGQPTVTAYRNPASVNTARYLVRPHTILTISW